MKVKVNLNTWAEVKQPTIYKDSIGCIDIRCSNIDCDECIFNPVIRIEKSKLEIKED